MSPIRIAHIIEATTGGVARHIQDLVAGLSTEDYISFLYVSLSRPESWRQEFKALAEQGITVRETPMQHIPNPTVVRKLAGWLEEDEINIAHTHSAKAGYLGRLAAAEAGVPAIYTPHAFPFQRTTDLLRPCYRIVERRLARITEEIICVSAGERELGLAAGLPDQKLCVIPNGLSLTRWTVPTPQQRREVRTLYGFANDDMIIGAVGRLTPQKGYDVLLAAAEELLPDFPQARFVFWGDGEQRVALQRMARRLRLPRIFWAGEIRDTWQAYAAMDIFCAPSRWEAGPYVLLEAMACALPIVASDVPGHADYLEDGESGMLVAPELPGPLEGALRSVLLDEDRRITLGIAARQRLVSCYTVERMIHSTESLYHRVAEKYHQ